MVREQMEDIFSAKKIIIYGAQVIAFGIYMSLKELTDSEILCFAVSDTRGNPFTIDDIPVLEISSLVNTEKETLIIVATPESYHAEIILILKNLEFGNIICIDSHMEYKIMSQFYRKHTKFKLLEDCIIEDCIDKRHMSMGASNKEHIYKELLDVKILMAKCHVDQKIVGEYTFNDWVVPIQVGAVLTDKRISELSDDTGVNISKKNRNYSELTATYWAWKNLKSEYKGICHYRRVFSMNEKQLYIIKKNDVDVVLPLPFICNPDASGQYRRYITDADLELVHIALMEMHSDYAVAFLDISKKPYLYNYNMLIAKRKVFDDYCAWIFPILKRIEALSDVENGKRNDRYIGYIGEILTALYFLHNKKNLNVVHGEKKWLV